MAKNIEININNGSNSYEILYPKASYSNMSDTLNINNTSGNLSLSRTTDSLPTSRLNGSVSKSNGGTGTTVTSGGSVFYILKYTGTETERFTITYPNFGLTLIAMVLHGKLTYELKSAGVYVWTLDNFFLVPQNTDDAPYINVLTHNFTSSQVTKLSMSSQPLIIVSKTSTSIVFEHFSSPCMYNLKNTHYEAILFFK